MGIFSSKKKHFVDTQVARVVEDNVVPSALTTALLESLFEDKKLITSIKNQTLNGSFRRFEQMYRFAEDEKYFYGLPDARVLSSSDGIPLAEAALDIDAPGTVTDIDYLYFRPLNNVHAGWQHLTDNLGYNHATNEIESLTATQGTEVYLEKLVAVHTSAAGLEPEHTSIGTWADNTVTGPTPVQIAWDNPADFKKLSVAQETRIGTGETESVEIHAIWLDGNGNAARSITVVDLSAYSTDREYYQARYQYTGGSGTQTGYWTYDPTTGQHPDLDAVFDLPDFISPGTYFPFVVFRSEGQNRATDVLSSTEAYETTTELLNFLDIDFREMADAMHENAGIDDVDQAVMLMGVPINSENDTEIEYLYRYFSSLHDRLPVEARSPVNYSAIPDLSSQFGLNSAPDQAYAVEITDADFSMTISVESVSRRYRTGSIGDVGTYTSNLDFYEPEALIFNEAGMYDAVAPRPVRIFRHQVTPQVYEEIRVLNPVLRYRIYNDLGTEGGAGDDKLLIPLDYEVVQQMSGIKRETLYYRSLHFVFNSHVVQEIKWYQTGLFGALLVAAAVVITIATYGATWKAALVAAAELGASAVVLAALKIVLTNVVKVLVVNVLFTQLAETIGVEAAYWLAIAAAAVGGYKGFQAGGFVEGSTATNLISASNGLVTGAQNALKNMMVELQEGYEDLQLRRKEALEEMEEAEKLLDTSLPFNPMSLISRTPLLIPGESADAYLSRTAETQNPGVESINLIQNFVENSLRLPSIQESLGA